MPDGWDERAEEDFTSTDCTKDWGWGFLIAECERRLANSAHVFSKPKALNVNCPKPTSQTQRDAPFYALAALAGIATGWVDITVNDLLLTALLVLAACITLGLMRPRRPWRWVVAVGVFIPLTEFAAYMVQAVKPTHAQIYGSFLASLPGIAGAYGGSFMRGVVTNLRQGK